MADDMTDKIKEILNNPEMMNMVSSLLGSANSGVSEEKEKLTSRFRVAVF